MSDLAPVDVMLWLLIGGCAGFMLGGETVRWLYHLGPYRRRR
jgi:hypothetical protein